MTMNADMKKTIKPNPIRHDLTHDDKIKLSQITMAKGISESDRDYVQNVIDQGKAPTVGQQMIINRIKKPLDLTIFADLNRNQRAARRRRSNKADTDD